MGKGFRGVATFTVGLILLYVLSGEAVTRLVGESGGGVAAEGVNPDAGREIFWGKGKCATCHSVGDEGSAIRCPNLGETGPTGLSMGLRAEQRATERQTQGASHVKTGTDYLVESIAEPDAYVVEGFKAEMPRVYQPPISLTADEIRAVITYLQSLGGEVDAAAIQLPAAVAQAAGAQAEGAAFRLYLPGDPERGEALFTGEVGDVACGKCHTVAGEGGQVGPELTDVAGRQTLENIVQSILEPSAVIASGFDPIVVRTKDNRTVNGVIKAEDDAQITIVTSDGEEVEIRKADMAAERRAPDVPSVMPGNFSEVLTIQQLSDLVAYLQKAGGVYEEPTPAEEGAQKPGPSATPTPQAALRRVVASRGTTLLSRDLASRQR
jgi:putative heme-binding domain-containing protein